MDRARRISASTMQFGSLNSIQLEFEQQRRTNFALKHFRKQTALCMTVIVIFCIVFAITILLVIHAPKSTATTQLMLSVHHTEPVTDLKYCNRSEWNATDSTLPLLQHPVDTVVIARTNTEECLTEIECLQLVKYLQAVHIYSRGKRDIAFNFLIGSDGKIYEGTGWNKQADITRGYNNHSLYLAFIGRFDNVMPSLRQMSAAKLFLLVARENGKLSESYALYGQRQVYRSTSSPGTALYAVIRTWDHFRENVLED